MGSKNQMNKKNNNCEILKSIIDNMGAFQLVLITKQLQKVIDGIKISKSITFYDLSTFLGRALSESVNTIYKKLEAFPFNTEDEISEVEKGVMKFFDTAMQTLVPHIEEVAGEKQYTELFYSQVKAEAEIGDAVLRDLLKKRKKENSYVLFVLSGIIALVSAIIGALITKL